MAGRKQFDVGEALERAMKAFWEHGYADASVDVLGTATGLSRSSLYGAFGGKDALFSQALDRYSAIFGDRYDQALADHAGDPVAAVEAFFEVTLQRIADPGVPVGCLIAQSAAQVSTLSARSRAHVRALVDGQRTRIRRALGSADRQVPRLDEVAEFVVAVNQSLAVMSRAGTESDRLRAVARIACDAVEAALRTSPIA